MRVLVACEESQAVTIAMRNAGHEAYSCDIIECSGGHPEWHIIGDAIEVSRRGDWDLMIAHPPCTRLANSGVRWLTSPPKNPPKECNDHDLSIWPQLCNEKKLEIMWRLFEEGAQFYEQLRCAPIKRIAIENPVFHRHAIQRLGKVKRHIVQPWWFGEMAFKATGFELINLPPLVATNKLTPPSNGTNEHKQWSWVHRLPPSPDRAKLRSKTFAGIAAAMAQQWT